MEALTEINALDTYKKLTEFIDYHSQFASEIWDKKLKIFALNDELYGPYSYYDNKFRFTDTAIDTHNAAGILKLCQESVSGNILVDLKTLEFIKNCTTDKVDSVVRDLDFQIQNLTSIKETMEKMEETIKNKAPEIPEIPETVSPEPNNDSLGPIVSFVIVMCAILVGATMLFSK